MTRWNLYRDHIIYMRYETLESVSRSHFIYALCVRFYIIQPYKSVSRTALVWHMIWPCLYLYCYHVSVCRMTLFSIPRHLRCITFNITCVILYISESVVSILHLLSLFLHIIYNFIVLWPFFDVCICRYRLWGVGGRHMALHSSCSPFSSSVSSQMLNYGLQQRPTITNVTR